jgi:non-heme chloroperoxidase
LAHSSSRDSGNVSFDRRGHGRSDQPWKGYDYDTLADDAATVIDQLDLRNLSMIGHSMGAGEVVRYLTRHGRERVVRIALLSGTTPFLLKTADNPEGVGPSSRGCARSGKETSPSG